jgi:hypothetical protein
MIANAEFTVHLEDGVTADIPVEARGITAEDQRATVPCRILTESWDNESAKTEHPFSVGR